MKRYVLICVLFNWKDLGGSFQTLNLSFFLLPLNINGLWARSNF